MIGNSNDGTNFPHGLLSTNSEAANVRNNFANKSSTGSKLSKT